VARRPARGRHRPPLHDVRASRPRGAARSREGHEAVRAARAARSGRLGPRGRRRPRRGRPRTLTEPRVPRDLGGTDPLADRRQRRHERAHHPRRRAHALEYVLVAAHPPRGPAGGPLRRGRRRARRPRRPAAGPGHHQHAACRDDHPAAALRNEHDRRLPRELPRRDRHDLLRPGRGRDDPRDRAKARAHGRATSSSGW